MSAYESAMHIIADANESIRRLREERDTAIENYNNIKQENYNRGVDLIRVRNERNSARKDRDMYEHAAMKAHHKIKELNERIEELDQDESEWKNGDQCIYANCDAVFIGACSRRHGMAIIEYNRDAGRWVVDKVNVSKLSKPLTKAEKKEKEREECIASISENTGLTLEISASIYDAGYCKVESSE